MSVPGRRTELAAYHAELAAAFAARRCGCGAFATVVIVGSDPVREAGILLKRGVADRNFCIACVAAAWPGAFQHAVA